ncbi:3'-5' exonuclease [Methyloglobulus sp.]|uniref:3'-5' exonuclease n=1 Tax=Methyloglobulus sp. TaxID=2518622 RepID=UPI0032B70FE1
MYLFFDTETTGVPRNYKAPVTDLTNWPRLVQIAWLLTDENANEIASAEYIVKPEGFAIPKEAIKIHGITTERAIEEGVDLKLVLTEAAAAIALASVLIAHNVSFDEKILGAEFLRSGQKNVVSSKQRLCTMQAATNYCQIPGPYGYKWPTLEELHKKLFNKSFVDAHQALADVRACAQCYFELKLRKVVV